jgi:actin-like ATPase involved in cell morphogenesis
MEIDKKEIKKLLEDFLEHVMSDVHSILGEFLDKRDMKIINLKIIHTGTGSVLESINKEFYEEDQKITKKTVH